MCKCSLPPSHIYDSEFTCIYNDAKEVIYRAKLQGIEARDCFNLINHLNEWKAAESTILIQGDRLKLNPSCDLEIESVDIQAACVIGEAPPTTSCNDGNAGDGIICECKNAHAHTHTHTHTHTYCML